MHIKDTFFNRVTFIRTYGFCSPDDIILLVS
jgi:hypothetical protein